MSRTRAFRIGFSSEQSNHQGPIGSGRISTFHGEIECPGHLLRLLDNSAQFIQQESPVRPISLLANFPKSTAHTHGNLVRTKTNGESHGF
jgi:hypothetical protein